VAGLDDNPRPFNADSLISDKQIADSPPPVLLPADLGRRERSIRYRQPHRPVERAKVQSIRDAAPLRSQAINSNWAKAIVVNRDDMAPEDREALKVPTSTTQRDMAPPWNFW